MTLSEIKSAVDAGRSVCWANDAYRLIRDDCGNYGILCLQNFSYIGLTWRDNVTLNGKEAEFFEV
jgi:hypothetical protein